jgi:nucleoside-diphosphate-sugar epimerase
MVGLGADGGPGRGERTVKALVTGASGFTGSHLARHLGAAGYDVRALVRRSSRLTALEGVPVELAYADLEKADPLDHAVQGVHAVFHIAALYRAENVSRRAFWDVNVEATRRLLEASERAGVRRFVHCSTVGVQGDIRNPPAPEEAPYSPGDRYQESKRDGELLALEWFRSGRVAGSVVRPTGIYGPGDLRFLKLFRMIDRGRFRMLGSGEVLYHLTYVEDLAQGLRLAGEREEALGEVFTIGGEGYLTLNQLVAKIAQALGRPIPQHAHIPVWPVWMAGLACELLCKPFGIEPPLYRRRVDFFTKSRAFDISKAKRLLGYRPQVSLEDGLRRTASWYREEGLLR